MEVTRTFKVLTLFEKDEASERRKKVLRKTSLLQLSIILLAGFLIGLAGTADASTNVAQTWLPGECIPQFAVPMPVFGPAGPISRVDASRNPLLTVNMKEINQQVLPNFTPGAGCPTVNIQPTRVWAYEIRNRLTKKLLGPAHWPAVTVVTQRRLPTYIQYVNNLPRWNQSITTTDTFNPLTDGPIVQGLITVDQTIHWANPLMNTGPMNCTGIDCTNPNNAGNPCCQPFKGAPPAVVHLHGGETPSAFDGGPEQWFTPNGRTGADYRSLDYPGPGKAIYVYRNTQEPGTLWFHDHALGATRTNVYSGMAAFYFLREPGRTPRNLPSGPYEIEMAIQDRQFDTNSQLFFPDGSGDPASNLNGTPPNPDIHPFWNPEFIGDVAIVNGAPWPYLNVKPRRYLFHLLDGSNARFYNLTFGSAPVYAIAADDNYLDAPVPVSSVFIAPGERLDVIVDFSGLAGQTVTVTNDAPVPYPMGLVPGVDQPSMVNIMRFNVSATAVSDPSCNPALHCKRPVPMVRLTDGLGNLAPGVTINKVRQLVLKEVQGPGGPIEVLVNNTKWDGTNSPSIDAIFPSDGVSELPRVGSTEMWEIINLTADAHPMHTHLIQFQILNRESFNPQYTLDWAAAFGNCNIAAPLLPGCVAGQFCPGYGPPCAYNVPNADGAIGGNPAISSYLLGNPTPPAPEESGFKDTAKVQPGQVMRIIARWAPTRTPVASASPGRNRYPFDPTIGPGYVWHCHIVDHEDNEMMRPYKVTK
jgi:spore coat protein A